MGLIDYNNYKFYTDSITEELSRKYDIASYKSYFSTLGSAGIEKRMGRFMSVSKRIGQFVGVTLWQYMSELPDEEWYECLNVYWEPEFWGKSVLTKEFWQKMMNDEKRQLEISIDKASNIIRNSAVRKIRTNLVPVPENDPIYLPSDALDLVYVPEEDLIKEMIKGINHIPYEGPNNWFELSKKRN